MRITVNAQLQFICVVFHEKPAPLKIAERWIPIKTYIQSKYLIIMWKKVDFDSSWWVGNIQRVKHHRILVDRCDINGWDKTCVLWYQCHVIVVDDKVRWVCVPTGFDQTLWYTTIHWDVCQALWAVHKGVDVWKEQLQQKENHGPLDRCIKLRVVHAPGMPGTFSPPPRISDHDMHHGTCVTHVPWYMPGCTTRNFTYLIKGPWCF